MIRTLVVIPLLAFAACSGADEVAPPPDEVVASPAPGPTTAIALSPLAAATTRNLQLEGELGCAFTRGGAEGDLLWRGAADVVGNAGAQSVAMIDGELRELAMDGTGGYNAMANGAAFVGDLYRIAIAKTGSEPLVEDPAVAMESPQYEAIMTVTKGGDASGETVEIAGVLECGP